MFLPPHIDVANLVHLTLDNEKQEFILTHSNERTINQEQRFNRQTTQTS